MIGKDSIEKQPRRESNLVTLFFKRMRSSNNSRHYYCNHYTWRTHTCAPYIKTNNCTNYLLKIKPYG